MNKFLNKIRHFFSSFSLANKKILKVNNDELTQLKAELQMRHEEAAQFKVALENKNAEIDLLRSTIKRYDLKSINEAIATFYESFEFFEYSLLIASVTYFIAIFELFSITS